MEQQETLVEVLRWRATHQPEQIVYTFLDDGGEEDERISFAELDRRARAIAAQLQPLAAPGERALLLYQPGPAYIAGFFGCLYAGVVAVPAYPPNPMRMVRTLPRLQAIAANAQARVALTTAGILSLAESVFEDAPDLAALRWLATDNLPSDSESTWQPPLVNGDTLAFLQYTSGSTGTPKGVMLTHANLLANSTLIADAFNLAQGNIGCSWLPPYHDMGLIGGLLQPVHIAAHCVLMSPMAFLQRPMRWLQVISRYGVQVSGGPNFAYDLCARKATPEQLAGLDLSTWRLAFNGAEPVRAETLQRFSATFASCGFRAEAFYPCYGLAEGTLFVSGGTAGVAPATLSVDADALGRNLVVVSSTQSRRDAESALSIVEGKQSDTDTSASLRLSASALNQITLVSCGYARPGQQLAVVDPETLAPRPPEGVGEIWVSGPSVAQGYWERPAESEQTFHARVAEGGAEPFLRTGDLGFVHGGQLYVTGRLKDLIIIDGRNHYPQDIETTVETSHPAIRQGCIAAFAVEVNGEERLVVAAEVERSFQAAQRRESGPTRQEVVTAVRRAIADTHDLRVHAVVLLKTGYIPKTSSGKIQRHACRAGFLAGTLDELEEP
ncbi:MAG: fatty acyl-AMP ligase [Chloroflexaceae bacterium]|nr:fatty acyl-AMP ligase [Chloroflexaceae bacterium]